MPNRGLTANLQVGAALQAIQAHPFLNNKYAQAAGQAATGMRCRGAHLTSSSAARRPAALTKWPPSVRGRSPWAVSSVGWLRVS